MALDAVELIACPECGCLNEQATALLDQSRLHIDGLERDLRVKRAKITRLEGERKDALIGSQFYHDAMEVLRYWSEKLAPNAREIDSTDRLEAVIARLKGKYTVAQLKECVDGYAKRPYVTREGRSLHGTPAERKVDASLIFGTPKHVDNGIAYAASGSSPAAGAIHSGSLERLSWRQVQIANRRLIIRALTERFGEPFEDDSMLSGGYLLSPCPRCDNAPICTLRIAPPGMGWVAQCSACGLDELRLMAAITEDTKP